MAQALAARSHLEEAMNEAQAALRLSPRDLEIHHTVGTIYERPHRYEEAAPGSSHSRHPLPHAHHREEAAWCRARTTARRPTGRARTSASCALTSSAGRSRAIRAPTIASTPSTSAW